MTILFKLQIYSCLDYCNSLFCRLSSHNATRLQYIQNAVARFVTGASNFTHLTSCMRTLHWLPIRQRIIFKTLVLVYKYLTTGQPKYFAPYLSLYKSAVNTRHQQFLIWCPKVTEWSSTWYTQCSKSLMFQKSTKNLLISEIFSTVVSNYQTLDCLPGSDLKYV